MCARRCSREVRPLRGRRAVAGSPQPTRLSKGKRTMSLRLGFSTLLLVLFASFSALADPLPTSPPESVGLSSNRLQLITDTLKADIDKGTIPGAVLLISRNGKIAYFEALGSLDPEKK